MPKVRKTKEWTESDALAEVIAADPCDFVLETSPPDYVEKISQLLGSSSVGQSGKDGAAADPADTDSDSADSLFITQKPVPEAVRSGRRRRYSTRFGPASPSFQVESEVDSSPSASPQKSRSNKNRKNVKFTLPKYSFPFLKDRTLKLTRTVLPGPENTRLHCSAMGGFFECVRKLRQSYQTGEDLDSHLPTVDMNGECIFPISEGEEQPLEDADIKVVAKKHFVVPSKVKHSQPWYSEKKSGGEGKQQRTINAVGMMSQGWRKTLHKIPTKRPSLRTALSSNLEPSDDEDPSYRILGEGGARDKQQKGERSVPAQSETPKTNRRVNREKKDNSEQKEKEDELCDDSSAPVCQPSPKESIQEGREVSITEPHADVLNREELSQAGQQDSKSEGQSFFQSGANDITICSETKAKKKNGKEDNESAAEDDSRSQEEPDIQDAAQSMNEEITEVEETPHEVHEHFDVRIREDSVHLISSNRGREKKKKDKEDDESAKEEMSQGQEEVQHAAAYEGITEVEETPRLSQITSELELNGRTGMQESDISDSQHKKKKKKKKNQNESSAEDIRQEAHEHFESDVGIGEDSAHLVSSNRGKKKKKKNDKEYNESVEEEKSQGQEEVQHAAVYEGITEVKETPRLCQITSELELNGKTGMPESDISDSQHKKKKKKKHNESSAEDIRQEVHEHFESDVRSGEDSAHLVSSNRGKRKKKKNNKYDNESVEEEMSQSQVEVQHDAAYVNEGVTEVETPRLSQITSELELDGKTGMQDNIISDSQHKKKKKKKKRQNESPAEDIRQEAHEHFESDVGIGEDSAHLVSSNRGKKKKKKKNNKYDNESVKEEMSQSQEELEAQHAAAYVNEGITEEEEIPSLSQSMEPEFSEKHMVESGIPYSQQKKKKKKKRKNESSAENEKTESNDDEEDVGQLKYNTAEATGSLEESNERVSKKKNKKRKMSAAQESVEKDQELDFEELNGTCAEALSDTGVRKKKKHKRNESGTESAADAGCWDEAVAVKKKRKKRMEEAAATGGEETESESLFERASPSLATPGNLARNEVANSKKKGKSAGSVLRWDKAKCYEDLTQTIDKKAEEKDRKKATSRSHFEPPSSHSVRKNKQKKRQLHNPSEDFLTDC